jgi:hypothetical protein
VKLNFSELHIERERDRWIALIHLATQLSDGNSPHRSVEALKISLTEARLREVLRDGFVLRRPVAEGTGELRVVVQDRTTGAAGEVRVILN